MDQLFQSWTPAGIEEVDLEDDSRGSELWGEDGYKWTKGAIIDSVKEEEKIEDNAAEKEFKRKMQLKKKITAHDLEFQRKFAMKKKQMALRPLHSYSKSLTGSDKLHKPIIMKEEKADKKAEKDKKEEVKKEEKVSKKQLEILEKRKLEEEKE